MSTAHQSPTGETAADEVPSPAERPRAARIIEPELVLRANTSAPHRP